MKKILSILSIFAITATSTGTVISCNSTPKILKYIQKAVFTSPSVINLFCFTELSSNVGDYVVKDSATGEQLVVSSVISTGLLSYNLNLAKPIANGDQATITYKGQLIETISALANY